jgi:hypothetical protein
MSPIRQVHFTAFDLDSRPRGGRSAGVIHFAPEMVRLEKAAGGALLTLGYTVHLNPDLSVSICNVTGEVYFQSTQQSSTALGIAADPESHVVHTGYKFPHGETASRITGCLRLPLSLAALETIERLREGGAADFQLTVHGSAFVFDIAEKTWDASRFQVEGGMPSSVQIQVRTRSLDSTGSGSIAGGECAGGDPAGRSPKCSVEHCLGATGQSRRTFDPGRRVRMGRLRCQGSAGTRTSRRDQQCDAGAGKSRSGEGPGREARRRSEGPVPLLQPGRACGPS